MGTDNYSSNDNGNDVRMVQIKINDLLTILNAAWTLQRKIKKQYDSESMPTHIAIPLFHLFNGFDSIDINILDLTGREYSEGLAVEIVGVDNHPNIGHRSYIVEMIRPVVMCRNELIQTGKVVLGKDLRNDQNDIGEKQ